MDQEYGLAEMRKVVTTAHLDDFVNVMSVFCTTILSYGIGLVSILLWLVYATQSIEVRNHVVKLVICCESTAESKQM